MDKLAKISIINPDDLDQKYYLKSLIQEGVERHLITDADMFYIEHQSLMLLKKVIGMLNANESFTVKIDRATALLESTNYTLGIYLKTLTPDEALELIKTEDWIELFKKGNNLIQKYIDKYKVFYNLLKANIVTLYNYSYIDTIYKEIDNFFKFYNKDFDAMNIIMLGEYPLFKSNPNLLGIEYIMEYMENLNIENLFLQNFDRKYLENLVNRLNIHEDLINIFEKVIFILIGEELSNHQDYNLSLNILESEDIYMHLSSKDKDEIDFIITSTLNKIYKKLDINDKIITYINKNLDYILSVFNNNIKNDTLDILFGIKIKKVGDINE